MLRHKCIKCWEEVSPELSFKQLSIGLILYTKCTKCGHKDSYYISKDKEEK